MYDTGTVFDTKDKECPEGIVIEAERLKERGSSKTVEETNELSHAEIAKKNASLAKAEKAKSDAKEEEKATIESNKAKNLAD